MQTAKKLVLVDKFDREYKRLQRPAAAVAKTGHSLRLSDTLRDGSLTDDRKFREYVGALHRYLNVDRRTPAEEQEEEHPRITWLTDPETRRSPPPLPTRTKRKKKKKTVSWEQY